MLPFVLVGQEYYNQENFGNRFLLLSGNVTDSVEDLEELDRFTTDLNLENKETDEWFGVTWGTKLKYNLSKGISAFASIYNYKNKYDLRYST